MFKSKIYILIIFVLSICIFGMINTNAQELPLLGKIIYIDPGHGGVDPGTIYKDIYEKDINLSICLKLQKNLENLGAIVYLTRYGDYDLSTPNTSTRKKSDLNNRVRLINDSESDMYISIHLNSVSSTAWHGAQVFYDDVNRKNIEIAKLFQEHFKKSLNTKREVKEIKTMLLNRKITIPGVLIEIGFLSNANDRYLLRQKWYHKRIAKNIGDVLINYYKA